MSEHRLRVALRSRLLRLLEDPVGDQRTVAAVERDAVSDSQTVGYELLSRSIAALHEEIERARVDIAQLADRIGEIRDITGNHLDRTPEHRRYLLAARESAEYAAAFAEPEPLVSVRIATYDRADVLFDRTLPSVLSQTYNRLEVIIVGDGCGERTIRRAQAVTDPRVRFVNLPHRGVYPGGGIPSNEPRRTVSHRSVDRAA